LKKDRRWVYDVPPAGNANFAWVKHFLRLGFKGRGPS
jgi:type I restriction enzyme M protein